MKKIHKLHKWIGVIIGVFLLTQCITGIIFLLPSLEVSTNAEPDLSQHYFQSMNVSPAEAIEILNKELDLPLQIKQINFKQIKNRIAYKISTKTGNVYLIDSVSGDRIRITQEFAKQIAQDKFIGSSKVVKVEKIDKYGLVYNWGPLPVYRVVFDGTLASSLYISGLSGEIVRKSNTIDKIRSLVLRFHDLSILTIFTKRGIYGKVLLVTLSLTSIVLIGLGYYLFVIRLK